MTLDEWIAELDRQCEKHYPSKFDVLTGASRSTVRLDLVVASDLDDYPAKPQVAWVIRPPGYNGDGSAYPFGYDKFVKVGSDKFRRGSGRSFAGRNALRHGRIRWAETMARVHRYRADVAAFQARLHAEQNVVLDKWDLWLWDKLEPYREYHHDGREWYALCRYPTGWYTVCSGVDRGSLYQSLNVYRSKSWGDVVQWFPILKQCSTNSSESGP